MTISPVHVIGAGLAGCEAVTQLTRHGIPVILHEMRPVKSDEAHKTAYFAELVCSNSLRAGNIENAVGLLKEEMRRLGSLIMQKADEHQVPAGGALAVDRDGFAAAVTEAVKANPLVTVIHEEVTDLESLEGTVIVASGPLTSDALFADIKKLLQADYLHFFDAAAPIVTADSLDYDKVYRASRYDKGGADYLNCPFYTKEEYVAFWEALCNAESAPVKDFEHDVFEACIDGTLDQIDLQFADNACVCIVLASNGYPVSYEKGFPIRGLETFKEHEGYYCFHAGTKFKDGEIVTNGGRVLGVTALGDTLKEARANAYKAVDWVDFDNKYYRHDIGKAIDEA